MAEHSMAYVAFDTSKLHNAVAIAEAGRAGEVRCLGEFENTLRDIRAISCRQIERMLVGGVTTRSVQNRTLSDQVWNIERTSRRR